MPAAASRAAAALLARRLRLAPGELLLDLGAGTGEVGAELCRLLPAGSLYLALDLSPGMLRVFGAKALRDNIAATAGSGARLARLAADAERSWPIESGRAAAIFCSRAAHRLSSSVFVAEARRVLRPGGRVFFGSLERSRDSVRAEMRRQMRRLLAETLAGTPDGEAGEPGGRDSRRRHEDLAAALGGTVERVAAASFEISERPADSLAGWRSKAGLAGLELPPEKQDEVLGRLEGWARERYVDLNRPWPAIERYELLIARVRHPEEKA